MDPERQGAVARHVSHRQAGHHRHREGGQTLAQQGLGLPGLPAAGEVAQRDATHVVEPAGAQQLGDPAVEAVGRLADVLEQRDAVGGGPDEAGAGAAGEDGEVAARDGALRGRGGRRAARGPAGGGRGARGAAGEREGFAVHDEGPHLSDRVRVAVPESRDAGAVDGGQTPSRRDGLVQCGDVGEADEQLRDRAGEGVPVEEVEHPLGAEAAAGGPHRGHVRVGPGAGEGIRAVGVVAGEPDLGGLGRRLDTHPQPPRLQHGDARREPVRPGRPRGGDDGDEVTLTQPGRAQQRAAGRSRQERPGLGRRSPARVRRPTSSREDTGVAPAATTSSYHSDGTS